MNTGLEYLENKKLEDYSRKELIPRKVVRAPLKGVLKVATKGKMIIDDGKSPKDVLEKINLIYLYLLIIILKI